MKERKGKQGKKQVIYRTPEGAEKQLDYILVNRKFMRCSTDAEQMTGYTHGK